MPKPLFTSHRLLPLTLAATLAVALLPERALGWTRLPGEVVKAVLQPFAHVGTKIAAWLRPHRQSAAILGITDEQLQQLLEQNADAERMLLAEQARVEALQQQLEQIQQVKLDGARATFTPLATPIGLRSPTSVNGPVVLSRGSSHGVKPGTVAVYNGDQLLGRVTDDVGAVQATLMPLVNPATGLIQAAIPATGVKNILLVPRGNGTLVGEVDNILVIHPGDVVRLLDDTWPASAQAMVIGAVESVVPSDRQPLRNTVVVRPSIQLSQLGYVVLKVEVNESLEGGGAAAGR